MTGLKIRPGIVDREYNAVRIRGICPEATVPLHHHHHYFPLPLQLRLLSSASPKSIRPTPSAEDKEIYCHSIQLNNVISVISKTIKSW